MTSTAVQASQELSSMYLVLPVPFRLHEGELWVESQAGNGLDRWAESFSPLRIAAPVIPESLIPSLAGFTWRKVSELQHADRLLCDPLPWAYSPKEFAKTYKTTRATLAEGVRQSRHLQFAIGGTVGDWAAIAALEAIAQKRTYSIHTDRVEHDLIRKTAIGASLARRLRVAVEAPLMERYHRHVIQHATLGLWHGDDCFRAYAPWLRKGANHLIHDVHTKPADLITTQQLTAKVADARTRSGLRVVYAGRLDAMKAPLEWLASVAEASNRGAELDAIWLGEGPLHDEAFAERKRLGLEDIVQYPGFVADRAVLLDHLRSADVLLFTHITPESPRILLETLVTGTPMLGYRNAFAEDLLQGHGGGELVPMHDTAALGTLLADLSRNREQLVTLMQAAAQNGQRFTDEAVFAERAALIRKYA
ncbi:MAG: glycosyltransferase [Acidobacteriaceae bacterium]|nr:glycosyltransferase [Acidobacteriaceae bacterium]